MVSNSRFDGRTFSFRTAKGYTRGQQAVRGHGVAASSEAGRVTRQVTFAEELGDACCAMTLLSPTVPPVGRKHIQ